MAVGPTATNGATSGGLTLRGIVVSLAVTDKPPDYIRSDAKCLSTRQPARLLQRSVSTRSRSTLQVDPESPPLDHLKINVPPADSRMVENQVCPRITTDQRKRLMQQP